MFGLSSASLGAILRSAGKTYDDIAKAGFGFAMIGMFLAIILLAIGLQISSMVSWLSLEQVTVADGGFFTILIASIAMGFGVFLSFILGAGLYDLSTEIIKSFK